MSNHYHLVLRIDATEAEGWNDDEVLARWTTLFRGPLLVQRYRKGEPLSKSEFETLRSLAAVYRARLASLSWFMKCLNEAIARKANAEDGCTGHFWEARFHSQALLSDQALIAAMAYVDLNPVRAGKAESPEKANYTSIRARTGKGSKLAELRQSVAELVAAGEIARPIESLQPLVPFSNGDKDSGCCGRNSSDPLPITWPDYLELVDSTGRCLAAEKEGRIDKNLSPVLKRLGLSAIRFPISPGSLNAYLRAGNWHLKKTA